MILLTLPFLVPINRRLARLESLAALDTALSDRRRLDALHRTRVVALGAAMVLFNNRALLRGLALYEGPHAGIDPRALGAEFYIPTAIVPLLLISHFLIFRLLMRKKEGAGDSTARIGCCDRMIFPILKTYASNN